MRRFGSRRGGIDSPQVLTSCCRSGSLSRVAAVALAIGGGVFGLACREAPVPAAPVRPLHIALPAEPVALDPHLHLDLVAASILSNIYEGLVGFDAEMSLLPALASSWESPDDLTWVFRLREDVFFHDGRRLTARDVLASFDRVRNHPQSQQESILVAVDSWRAQDPETVEVRTRLPYPILLNKLAQVMIVPADSPDLISTPVGTGPFRFVARRPGAIELAPHDRHWRGPPEAPAVTFHLEPDAEVRVSGLLEGRFDLIQDLSSTLRSAVRTSHQTRLVGRDSLLVNYLRLLRSEPPFSDPRVREAIRIGLDREELVRELLAGLGTPAGQMVGPNVFGYDPEYRPPPFDLERARSLLAAAGIVPGTPLRLTHRAGVEVEPIVRQLARLGFAVEPQPMPWEVLYHALQGGGVKLYYGSYACTSGDASDLFDSMVRIRDGRPAAGNPPIPGLAELIQTASVAGEMTARRALLTRVMREVMGANGLVPLLVPRDEYGIRRDLRWKPRLDGSISVTEIGFAPRP